MSVDLDYAGGERHDRPKPVDGVKGIEVLS
jgi:hypothetical protein